MGQGSGDITCTTVQNGRKSCATERRTKCGFRGKPRTFSAADKKLATEWYQRHMPLERIEHAYLLGCARKYMALLNHPSAALISSLHYFNALLREMVELRVSADYWSYLSHKVDQLEQRWRRDAAAVRVGLANFAPPKRRSATTQNKGETR